MTMADVIDKYGHKMNQDQLESLEAIYPVKSAGYLIPGQQNDGSLYDATRDHAWNTQGPSLGMRQFLSARDTFMNTGDDIIYKIFSETEDAQDFNNWSLIRVTTVYWKSQRMVGHLSKIGDDGILVDMVVDESYKVTHKPVYDTSVLKNKNREMLVS